jgi:hypothetical protein
MKVYIVTEENLDDLYKIPDAISKANVDNDSIRLGIFTTAVQSWIQNILERTKLK